ncbi:MULTISPECIES: Crp/Fnr family transcriptional regulator [Rhizobium]|uniref:Crp/Fnr family transcriptional regulator n=1 Tax=Rhizobium rhododendri TaxID=2506430 RepID=A0ABY8IPT0_9HYPH|nr:MULTISPECIES: Crp/Fnr family transcriptional regulator [Rhizobium]TQX83404.1 Crp/Fnr family transcriptional regulator [Rhizobium sp. rho-13.1]TQY06492.1 Crp/Fnr family transcriptional regulator [Rhizobium sp. rho-1.1]WFS25739.1 Crp/Fnr family transcriptional regulator [Rhizobium rhododendri]
MFNRLIALMEEPDRKRLVANFEPVELPRLFEMAEPNKAAEYSFFLESGIGSVVAVSPAGHEVEVAIFGREGMSPPNSLFEDDQAPFKVFMQVEGKGNRILNDHLFEALAASRALRKILSRYAQALFVQTSFTALSNTTHSVERRLARWLLMVHDRTAGNELPVTHEFLGAMLNVRRQSVTTSLHQLEGDRLVYSSRGLVTIRDRKRLEAFAGEAYGLAETEFCRLIGSMG